MKLVRGLQRGLAVMRALQGAPALSLAALHRQTALPKATLLRILATLEAEQLVWRSLGDGLFRYRALGPPAGWSRNQRLAEIAAPHLVALQSRALWPSDLVVRRRHVMELVETSRGMTQVALSRDPLGEAVDMAETAAGRAFLAHCPEPERRRIIEYLVAHPRARGALGPLDRAKLERVLTQTQARGYATRDRGADALAHMGRADDGLDAIAVPLAIGARVIGAVNLVWPRRFDLREWIIARHLADLRATAESIGREMESDAPRAPRVRRPTPLR